MKTLLLVRHAKSSHAEPTISDHDRPLNQRGEKEAPQIGVHLAETDSAPDWILSSTALRARETARHLAEACGFTGTIDLRRELYLATPDSIVRVLRSLPSEPQRVLLVAHNPGLESFLAELTDGRHALPTSAVATVRLKLDDWSDFVPGTSGKVTSLWRPSEEVRG